MSFRTLSYLKGPVALGTPSFVILTREVCLGLGRWRAQWAKCLLCNHDNHDAQSLDPWYPCKSQVGVEVCCNPSAEEAEGIATASWPAGPAKAVSSGFK